jgi:hypothetical protein
MKKTKKWKKKTKKLEENKKKQKFCSNPQ